MTDSERRTADSAFTYELSANESPTEGVVEAVSAVSGLDPVPDETSTDGPEETLDPLYTAVDPEALDSVFRRSDADATRSSIHVTFHYHGYEVTVRPERNISVVPVDADEAAASDGNLCVSQ